MGFLHGIIADARPVASNGHIQKNTPPALSNQSTDISLSTESVQPIKSTPDTSLNRRLDTTDSFSFQTQEPSSSTHQLNSLERISKDSLIPSGSNINGHSLRSSESIHRNREYETSPSVQVNQYGFSDTDRESYREPSVFSVPQFQDENQPLGEVDVQSNEAEFETISNLPDETPKFVDIPKSSAKQTVQDLAYPEKLYVKPQITGDTVRDGIIHSPQIHTDDVVENKISINDDGQEREEDQHTSLENRHIDTTNIQSSSINESVDVKDTNRQPHNKFKTFDGLETNSLNNEITNQSSVVGKKGENLKSKSKLEHADTEQYIYQPKLLQEETGAEATTTQKSNHPPEQPQRRAVDHKEPLSESATSNAESVEQNAPKSGTENPRVSSAFIETIINKQARTIQKPTGGKHQFSYKEGEGAIPASPQKTAHHFDQSFSKPVVSQKTPEVKIGQVDIFIEAPKSPSRGSGSRHQKASNGFFSRNYLRRI